VAVSASQSRTTVFNGGLTTHVVFDYNRQPTGRLRGLFLGPFSFRNLVLPIRADNDPRYTRRFLIMGIIAIGFAAWSLYDGMVKYPAQRKQGFSEFKVDYKPLFQDSKLNAMTVDQFEGLADEKPRLEWAKYCHERGIKMIPEIFTQYIQAVIAVLAGLYLLSLPIRARGRWIEADESGITSSWGESLRYDQIEQVNKRKWRDKGIAKVTYIDGGKRKTFVVDDFKFMRDPTDQILYELEQRIEPERITGGPPEHPPGESVGHSAELTAPASADEPS
jgi:hypothetical protein